MVSADSLNLDVLELIFAFLSARDLPSVALVSRSFLAAVIPRLYRTLSFRLHHAKRYPRVPTSFQSVLAHPALAVHVRHIDIRSAPLLPPTPTPFPTTSSSTSSSSPSSPFPSSLAYSFSSPSSSPHPHFIATLISALKLTTNLQSLTYTPDTGSLPTLLPYLKDKRRLESLRVCAARVTSEQAEMLLGVDALGRGGEEGRGSLGLEWASWAVVGVLPRWVGGGGGGGGGTGIARGLGVLTLYMCNDLNEPVLESTLQHLPHLIGLHIIGCAKIDHATVLKLTAYTPNLESLALTCTTSDTSPTQPPHPHPPPLFALRSLALDARTVQHVLAVLTHLHDAFPPLTNLVLKIPEFGFRGGGGDGGGAGGVGGVGIGGVGIQVGGVVGGPGAGGIGPGGMGPGPGGGAGAGGAGAGNAPHLPTFTFGPGGIFVGGPNANANANPQNQNQNQNQNVNNVPLFPFLFPNQNPQNQNPQNPPNQNVPPFHLPNPQNPNPFPFPNQNPQNPLPNPQIPQNETDESHLTSLLISSHAPTLKRLSLIDCKLSIPALGRVCAACEGLEVLGFPYSISGGGLQNLVHALSHSHTLHTLVDLDTHTHMTHGARRVPLGVEGVRALMGGVGALRRVVSGGRVWSGHTDAKTGKLVITFEKQSAVGPRTHWFMPPGQGY